MHNDQLFYRSMAADLSGVDEKNRTVEISFSSEMPANRSLVGFTGKEYILHGEDNVNLDRIRSIGSVLYHHNPEKIIGPVKKVWIDNRVTRAVIGFDKDEEGERALLKAKSGSLRGVSCGYKVEAGKRIFPGDTYNIRAGFDIKGPAIIGTKWTPYEITLTPIPVDDSVGFGRSERSLDGIQIEEINPPVIEIGLPENHIYRKKLKLHRRKQHGY